MSTDFLIFIAFFNILPLFPEVTSTGMGTLEELGTLLLNRIDPEEPGARHSQGQQGTFHTQAIVWAGVGTEGWQQRVSLRRP